MNETLAQTLEAWQLSMRAHGCRPATVTQRLRLVRQAARVGDPRSWTRPDVERFLAEPSWSANTRVTYYRFLNVFYGWLLDTERVEQHPMARMRRPPLPRGVPRPIDTDLLGRAIETATGDLRAVLILAAYAGMRRTEIAAMRGEQIRGGEIVIDGKGGVVASVPLHPAIAEIARQYPARGYWFPGRPRPGGQPTRYEHCSPEWITASVQRHVERLGGRATPHTLRHWFGTEVLEASGGNLRVTQQVMRHANSALTERYTLVRSSRRTAAVLALPDVVGGAR